MRQNTKKKKLYIWAAPKSLKNKWKNLQGYQKERRKQRRLYTTVELWHGLKTGPRTTVNLRKTGPPYIRLTGKTGPKRLKTLPFVSNVLFVEVTHFHRKCTGTQGFVFVERTFGKCATLFYFKNGQVVLKTTIANLQPLLAMKRFRMFTHFYVASFLIKTCFYETENHSCLENWTYFHKMVRCFGIFNKNKG